MANRDLVKKVAAGMFFISLLVMIGGFVFVLGVQKGFTEPKFQMNVMFRKVGGLNIGAPVRLSGVNVGTVQDINFLDQEIEGRGVKVTLNLFKKYDHTLAKSTQFAIITEGVLGEKLVEITTTPGYARKDLSVPVIGVDPLDVQNLAQTFGETAISLNGTAKTMDTMINQLQDISATTKRMLNRIEQRVIDGTLFKVF